MTYEKTEQKKKAQMNLENCRYVSLSQTSATLDSTPKAMLSVAGYFTSGSESKNS